MKIPTSTIPSRSIVEVKFLNLLFSCIHILNGWFRTLFIMLKILTLKIRNADKWKILPEYKLVDILVTNNYTVKNSKFKIKKLEFIFFPKRLNLTTLYFFISSNIIIKKWIWRDKLPAALTNHERSQGFHRNLKN